MEELVPIFEADHSARVDVIAVGTGAALKLGMAGDVDALICHAEADELAFMESQHGSRREPLMSNSFYILGPASDPANIAGLAPPAAFSAIRASQQPFASRGDDSGTHKCEMRIWEQAGGAEAWSAYNETGQGMGRTLIVADQLQAYVLTDQGTYLKFKNKLTLRPLIRSGQGLENRYSVIVVNPNKNKRMNGSLAKAFLKFLLSAPAQQRIGDYRVDGEQLFVPRKVAVTK